MLDNVDKCSEWNKLRFISGTTEKFKTKFDFLSLSLLFHFLLRDLQLFYVRNSAILVNSCELHKFRYLLRATRYVHRNSLQLI